MSFPNGRGGFPNGAPPTPFGPRNPIEVRPDIQRPPRDGGPIPRDPRPMPRDGGPMPRNYPPNNPIRGPPNIYGNR